jgi:hypothetical protein
MGARAGPRSPEPSRVEEGKRCALRLGHAHRLPQLGVRDRMPRGHGKDHHAPARARVAVDLRARLARGRGVERRIIIDLRTRLASRGQALHAGQARWMQKHRAFFGDVIIFLTAARLMMILLFSAAAFDDEPAIAAEAGRRGIYRTVGLSLAGCLQQHNTQL